VLWLLCEKRSAMLRSFATKTFPGCLLREAHGTKLRYEVPSQGTTLAAIFGTLEERRTELFIEDYAVSQTSLEQIFNSFASEQEDASAGTVTANEGSAKTEPAMEVLTVPTTPQQLSVDVDA